MKSYCIQQQRRKKSCRTMKNNACKSSKTKFPLEQYRTMEIRQEIIQDNVEQFQQDKKSLGTFKINGSDTRNHVIVELCRTMVATQPSGTGVPVCNFSYKHARTLGCMWLVCHRSLSETVDQCPHNAQGCWPNRCW